MLQPLCNWSFLRSLGRALSWSGLEWMHEAGMRLPSQTSGPGEAFCGSKRLLLVTITDDVFISPKEQCARSCFLIHWPSFLSTRLSWSDVQVSFSVLRDENWPWTGRWIICIYYYLITMWLFYYTIHLCCSKLKYFTNRYLFQSQCCPRHPLPGAQES